MKRFEMVEDGASKFWEVGVEGSALTVRWGRIGTAGQSKRTELADEAAAEIEATKLIKQKTGKGYLEVGATEPSPTPAQAAPPAKPEKTPKTPATALSTAQPAPAASSQAASSLAASSMDLPSSTPRHGALSWVLASGGGRDALGIDLPDATIVVGRHACAWLASRTRRPRSRP